MKMLHENILFRSIALPILKAVGRDITIRHHWTGRPLKLNLFAHKGYWYHGRHREEEEMRAIGLLVQPGDTAVEVGGHIGYITLLLAQAVGNGRVTVFEPGSNNLPYLRTNIAGLDNITLIEKGCGQRSEDLIFYEESLTGQNNSFVSSFRGLEDNRSHARTVQVDVAQNVVSVIRLDETVSQSPSFVKVDVEGFEYSVLRGSEGWFVENGSPPIIMIEVQADHDAITAWFHSRGYQLFDIGREPMPSIPHTTINLFALHPQHHALQLERWLGNR